MSASFPRSTGTLMPKAYLIEGVSRSVHCSLAGATGPSALYETFKARGEAAPGSFGVQKGCLGWYRGLSSSTSRVTDMPSASSGPYEKGAFIPSMEAGQSGTPHMWAT